MKRLLIAFVLSACVSPAHAQEKIRVKLSVQAPKRYKDRLEFYLEGALRSLGDVTIADDGEHCRLSIVALTQESFGGAAGILYSFCFQIRVPGETLHFFPARHGVGQAGSSDFKSSMERIVIDFNSDSLSALRKMLR